MKQTAQSAADAGGVVGPDVVAACGLAAVPGLGASSLARIALLFRSLSGAVEEGPRAIVAASEKLRLKREAVDYLKRDPDLEELGAWAVAAAKKANARVVLLGDDWYPLRLREIKNPPPVLYVKGNLAPDARRVAVVGSREVDEQGMEIARSFGDALARAGVTVVSGGARGIDTAAHDGSFWGSGQNVAVLGCGIDVTYPPENADVFERIVRGAGALVSEFPPGTPPVAHNFPRRNRTIAGLSDAVVVVRAAMQSGALITANHAAAEDRTVFAVPGDPGNPHCAGSNALLRSKKVKTATSALDLLEGMRWPVPEELTAPPSDEAHRTVDPGFPQEAAQERERTPTDEQVLDSTSLSLWQLLDERVPTHVDDLASRAQIGAPEALRKLAELELKGMCVQRPGKYFLRR